MTEGILSDEQIEALSGEQRRELITRLEKPLSELEDPEVLARMRRIRLGLIVGGLIVMIPWIGYLSVTLPQKYVAHNWPATWIGFDILLLGFMAATAVLGFLRRQLIVLTGFMLPLGRGLPERFGDYAHVAAFAHNPLGKLFTRDELTQIASTLTVFARLAPICTLQTSPSAKI